MKYNLILAMELKLIPKPKTGEYAPYTSMYIDLLPDDGLILKHLQDNLENTIRFIPSLPDEKLTYRLANGEWTIKEILVHIIDDERFYCYRTLRYARNDTTELAGIKQDNYVPLAAYHIAGHELHHVNSFKKNYR